MPGQKVCHLDQNSVRIVARVPVCCGRRFSALNWHGRCNGRCKYTRLGEPCIIADERGESEDAL